MKTVEITVSIQDPEGNRHSSSPIGEFPYVLDSIDPELQDTYSGLLITAITRKNATLDFSHLKEGGALFHGISRLIETKPNCRLALETDSRTLELCNCVSNKERMLISGKWFTTDNLYYGV